MAYRVELLESAETFCVEEGESILDGATRANVKLPHECTFGGCGTCRVRVQEGRVSYTEFPMALTEEEHALGYALACQARAGSDLTLSVAASRISFAEPVCVTASITHIHSVCTDVIHLGLEFPDGAMPAYRPGQYMNVLLPDGGTRSFSMASPPNGNLADFHVRRIPGGRFTEALLQQAAPGTPLQVQAPLGTFCLHEEDYRPLLMVATGTGIAPIKAMLESLLDNPDCPPVTLYWGMRGEQDLYLRDAIESWRGRLYEFQFVPVLSRGGDQWQGRRGHVQDAVAEDLDDLSEHAIYLCGSPDMVNEAKALFAMLGASMKHIHADSFSFQHHVAPAPLAEPT
jgi:CDP-4-dehydro-6-deoxyglucose reductase